MTQRNKRWKRKQRLRLNNRRPPYWDFHNFIMWLLLEFSSFFATLNRSLFIHNFPYELSDDCFSTDINLQFIYFLWHLESWTLSIHHVNFAENTYFSNQSTEIFFFLCQENETFDVFFCFLGWMMIAHWRWPHSHTICVYWMTDEVCYCIWMTFAFFPTDISLSAFVLCKKKFCSQFSFDSFNQLPAVASTVVVVALVDLRW